MLETIIENQVVQDSILTALIEEGKRLFNDIKDWKDSYNERAVDYWRRTGSQLPHHLAPLIIESYDRPVSPKDDSDIEILQEISATPLPIQKIPALKRESRALYQQIVDQISEYNNEVKEYRSSTGKYQILGLGDSQ